MTSAVELRDNNISAELMESVVIEGDLSKLSSSERLDYYQAVCKSLGLNPLTKPFQYLRLNNKLVLYALRECTEQLRRQHNISTTITGRETFTGVYVVTARATMPDGRTDESTGAVPIENLKGESLANAYMKAETKAKRRVTLSICGLGFLDESEVDSIPEARIVPVDHSTGELPEGRQEASQKPSQPAQGQKKPNPKLEKLKALDEVRYKFDPEGNKVELVNVDELTSLVASRFEGRKARDLDIPEIDQAIQGVKKLCQVHEARHTDAGEVPMHAVNSWAMEQHGNLVTALTDEQMDAVIEAIMAEQVGTEAGSEGGA